MAGWDAFISYSSADAVVAARVQRALERYRLPDGRRLRVYRDETDIAGGELPGQLRRALAESRALVVCCSGAAAASRWVDLEIGAFRELAPDRPVLSVLVAEEPPDNLPRALGGDASTRWADLRAGWRLGVPRSRTRVELVRVVAGVAGIDFRELLPLDRRRRRRRLLTTAATVATALVAAAWIPVRTWIDVTPTRTQAFQCDQLDDDIAWLVLNEPYAIKNIVTLEPAGLSGASATGRRRIELAEFVPRGRLLPPFVADTLRAHCGSDAAWIGEPEAGLCVGVRESEETGFFADPMGGFDAPVTDVVVGDGPPSTLQSIWRRVDMDAWREQYGIRTTPSAGLPVAAAGDDVWLGFAQDQLTPGGLWHTADRGRSWDQLPHITDVRSIRRLDVGLLVAARRNRELGFYRLDDTTATPFDVPGKGDDLEVCGQVDGQPVIRADRSAYRRARRPWWRTVLR